jgi:NADH-quinone oxidoreductase subunit M
MMVLAAVALLWAVQGAQGNQESVGLIQPQIVFSPTWMELKLPFAIQGHSVDWQLQMGADSFSAMMVLLTSLVTFAVLMTAKTQITERRDLYDGMILITQGILMGIFLAMDLLLFYVFFEAVLIPIILLMNIWGDSKESLRASRKFLLFTLAGSIPMVVGIVGIVLQSATAERASTVLLPELSALAFETQLTKGVPVNFASGQFLILAALMLGFGIKMALLPLHSWLPTTYAASHPNTTALIAAVVGKLGVYGLLRIVLPLTPVALSVYCQIVVGTLGAIAVVYGALIALKQTDLRRLMAYSSLSHMGFVTLGLMAMNREGIAGATIQMFNHGLITAAMFLMVGMIEQRRGRLVLGNQNFGLAAAYPHLGFLMVFFTLAGAGLPGLNSFVGEVLAMMGMLRVSAGIVSIAVLGTVLGAWYALRVLQHVMFSSDGKTSNRAAGTSDIGWLDWGALAPLAILCIVIGVRPTTFTDTMKIDVDRMAVSLEPTAKALHPTIDTLVVLQK